MTFTDYEHGPGCTLGERGQPCDECRRQYAVPLTDQDIDAFLTQAAADPARTARVRARYNARIGGGDGVSVDRCRVCGRTIGVGIPALHLGICEACRDTERPQ